MDRQPSIQPVHTAIVEAPSSGDCELEALAHNSPIACLSEELLTLVLDTVRDSYDGPEDSMARAKLPIIASHVSRFWRFVALDNPLWWSNIVVNPPWRLDAVKAYLRRSKQCLLDISVFDNGETAFSPEFLILLDLLLPYFLRCRALDIRKVFNGKDAEIQFSFFERVLDADMPYLEELTLGLTSYDSLMRRRMRPFFPTSTLLRDLRLIGIGIQRFSVPLPLANGTSLKSLHLSKISGGPHTTFSELQTILQACLSLSTLAIYGDLLIDWPGLSISCYMPSLESIYILGNMRSVSELLLSLVAPKLKDLVIAPVIPSDLTLLLSQPTRDSAPNQHRFFALRSLQLAPSHQDSFTTLQRASACFPQIEYLLLLNLHHFDFTELFTYKGDDIDDDAGVLFPNLLDLGLTDIDETYYKSIRDVQVFRAQQDLPLRTVYVDSESLKLIKSRTKNDDEPFDLDVVEGNLWKAQRRGLLHTEVKDMFVGHLTWSMVGNHL